MRTSLAFLLCSVQLFVAGAELILQHLMEAQTLSLSCSLQQNSSSRPAGLNLYHRDARSQTTLLSIAEGGEVRVDPGRGTRLQLSGGLNSQRVNVTIAHLELSDTGLYVWELSYREEMSSSQLLLTAPKILLLVEASGRLCPCSASYPPLLLTIFSAAGLLLLILICLAIEKCMRVKQRRRPQPHAPIYEEMSWKQQRAGSPQNSCEGPSHLEEVHVPVYANPHRQPQDNYYACPRQLALQATYSNV